MMELIIDKELKTEVAVRNHPLFGKAVFLECGLHDPDNFCFDHHTMGVEAAWSLSTAGMIHQQMLQRREFPTVVIQNHVRHLDNLVALYLLNYRSIALHPDTFALVAVADTMDRVGPLASSAMPQLTLSVLLTAQNLIPFKEWELSEDELRTKALEAIASLKGMVTSPSPVAEYVTHWESSDRKFAVVQSDQQLGNTLYDQGYTAYAVYSEGNGVVKWTLARASEYVPFDIPGVVAELNQIEGLDPKEGWGGRPVIGGSPKNSGTKLTVNQVIEVLRKHWQQ